MQSYQDLEKLAAIDAPLNEARIERYFEARQCGDFETITSYLRPYMTYELAIPKGINPLYHGPSGFDSFLRINQFNFMTYEWLEHEITDMRVSGSQAVVRRECLGRNRGTALVQVLHI